MSPAAKPGSRAAYREGERLVKNLLQVCGEHTSYELFRRPMQEYLKHLFLTRGGQKLTQSKSSPNVLRLVKKKHAPLARATPPGSDHAEMYSWNGKPLYYVFHPYEHVDEVALRKFCEEHGLAFSVSPDSWYYLGRTLRVTIYEPSREQEYWETCRRSQE